jgi:hypothetical protein
VESSKENINKFKHISTRWPWFFVRQGRAEEMVSRVLSDTCRDTGNLQQKASLQFFITANRFSGLAHADHTPCFQGDVWGSRTTYLDFVTLWFLGLATIDEEPRSSSFRNGPFSFLPLGSLYRVRMVWENKIGNSCRTQHRGVFVQPLLEWKNNKDYIFWMCVCSLSYTACNARHLWPVRLFRIFPS